MTNSIEKSTTHVPLRDILVSLETGGRPVGGAQGIESGIPSISAEHMTPLGSFDFSEMRFVPEDFYQSLRRGRIRLHDILIVKDGATTGKVAYVAEDFPYEDAAINEHVFLCRVKRDIAIPKYIFYYLLSEGGQESIRNSYQGAAIGGINQSFAEKVIVPLVSLHDQLRIVIRLDQMLSVTQHGRTAAEERLKAAKALPAAYLRSTFAEIEREKYPHVRLGNVTQLLPSKSIALNGDALVPVITTACLTEFGFEPSGIKEGRMWQVDVVESRVAIGEILIARSNTPDLVGRVSMFSGMQGDVYASDLTIRLVPIDTLDPGYLTYYLTYLYLTGYWKEKAGGASGSMKKITRTHIQNLMVPVPPRSEQVRIENQLRSVIAKARQLVLLAESQYDSIDAIPHAFLREAFNSNS